MTHILATTMLLILACVTVSFLPSVSRRLKGAAGRVQRGSFAVLVGVFWVFSLHETIKETGFVYGVLFSLIPLAAGAVVLSRMAASKQ